MFELIYLYHSGFVLIGDEATIVFDFFEDSVSPREGILHSDILFRTVPLYVLASHAHSDHFNPDILKWKDIHPHVKYFFSADIRTTEREQWPDSVCWMDKGDEYADNLLKIKAFGSTDVGVSYLVEFDGKKIFHAGDLNNWHWMDECDEPEWRCYEANYFHELEAIKRYTRSVDIAMFPVDPRLGSQYMRGAYQFVHNIKTRIFVPMHFDQAYEKAALFAPLAATAGAAVPDIRMRGQKINWHF